MMFQIHGILRRAFLTWASVLVFGFGLNAEDYPKRPQPPRLVNDLANIFKPNERQELEQMLVAYNDSTSTQIVVVTVKSTEGQDINFYAAKIGDDWGVGQKYKDNGLVLCVAVNDRKMAIQTGRGIEEHLNARLTKRIIEDFIVPEFKNGNYYAGVQKGVLQIIAVLSGQFVNENPNGKPMPPLVLIALIILIVFIVLAARNRGGGGGYMLGPGGGHFFGPRHFGGFGGGGFGGGGGGFGGFGGGSFGGGGASGSW